MNLNNNEVFALADYLRHQLAIDYPMEQYFIEKAAQALEDLANERAELKAEIALLNTPMPAFSWSRILNGRIIRISPEKVQDDDIPLVISKSYKPSENDSNN